MGRPAGLQRVKGRTARWECDGGACSGQSSRAARQELQDHQATTQEALAGAFPPPAPPALPPPGRLPPPQECAGARGRRRVRRIRSVGEAAPCFVTKQPERRLPEVKKQSDNEGWCWLGGWGGHDAKDACAQRPRHPPGPLLPETLPLGPGSLEAGGRGHAGAHHGRGWLLPLLISEGLELGVLLGSPVTIISLRTTVSGAVGSGAQPGLRGLWAVGSPGAEGQRLVRAGEGRAAALGGRQVCGRAVLKEHVRSPSPGNPVCRGVHGAERPVNARARGAQAAAVRTLTRIRLHGCRSRRPSLPLWAGGHKPPDGQGCLRSRQPTSSRGIAAPGQQGCAIPPLKPLSRPHSAGGAAGAQGASEPTPRGQRLLRFETCATGHRAFFKMHPILSFRMVLVTAGPQDPQGGPPASGHTEQAPSEPAVHPGEPTGHGLPPQWSAGQRCDAGLLGPRSRCGPCWLLLEAPGGPCFLPFLASGDPASSVTAPPPSPLPGHPSALRTRDDTGLTWATQQNPGQEFPEKKSSKTQAAGELHPHPGGRVCAPRWHILGGFQGALASGLWTRGSNLRAGHFCGPGWPPADRGFQGLPIQAPTSSKPIAQTVVREGPGSRGDEPQAVCGGCPHPALCEPPKTHPARQEAPSRGTDVPPPPLQKLSFQGPGWLRG
ncbi:uncharacterized protein LOC121487108 [Vulpes lagopus]|uniref:uncharacterized protein LOC121487108 n=1 Tax=Vulpes lagopus TaxID=494514 RepID=UPI001BC9708E|nr:uncharacterized protein LOC121487108 [Vulpes lagopus]